jgi:hypothetical protein
VSIKLNIIQKESESSNRNMKKVNGKKKMNKKCDNYLNVYAVHWKEKSYEKPSIKNRREKNHHIYIFYYISHSKIALKPFFCISSPKSQRWSKKLFSSFHSLPFSLHLYLTAFKLFFFSLSFLSLSYSLANQILIHSYLKYWNIPLKKIIYSNLISQNWFMLFLIKKKKKWKKKIYIMFWHFVFFIFYSVEITYKQSYQYMAINFIL